MSAIYTLYFILHFQSIRNKYQPFYLDRFFDKKRKMTTDQAEPIAANQIAENAERPFVYFDISIDGEKRNLIENRHENALIL